MADKTIAALTDGATAHLTDKIYASRDPFDASGDVWICPQYIRDMLRGSEHTWTKTQTIALGTITDPANILALSATWNDAADTFTGISLSVTSTASAAASKLIDLSVGGSTVFQVRKDGFVQANAEIRTLIGVRVLSNTGYLSLGTTGNVILTRDADDVLAQRNGSTAQAFRIYNTYTDASNYERLDIGWSLNTATILQQSAGAGTARSLRLGVVGNSSVEFASQNIVRWLVNNNGHFLANADNTYDIGASGANRPRHLYLAGSIAAGGNITSAGNIAVADGIAAPSATVGVAKLFVDTADGDLKVIFGDGTVKTIMTDT